MACSTDGYSKSFTLDELADLKIGEIRDENK